MAYDSILDMSFHIWYQKGGFFVNTFIELKNSVEKREQKFHKWKSVLTFADFSALQNRKTWH